jgi:hypothetical protein
MKFNPGDKVRPLLAFTNMPYQTYTIEECEGPGDRKHWDGKHWCSFVDTNGVYDPEDFELALSGPEEAIRLRTLEGVLQILKHAESVDQAKEYIQSLLEISKEPRT